MSPLVEFREAQSVCIPQWPAPSRAKPLPRLLCSRYHLLLWDLRVYRCGHGPPGEPLLLFHGWYQCYKDDDSQTPHQVSKFKWSHCPSIIGSRGTWQVQHEIAPPVDIIVCIHCHASFQCSVFNIKFAIVAAIISVSVVQLSPSPQVGQRYNRRDYPAARRFSGHAKLCTILSLIFGVIFMITTVTLSIWWYKVIFIGLQKDAEHLQNTLMAIMQQAVQQHGATSINWI